MIRSWLRPQAYPFARRFLLLAATNVASNLMVPLASLLDVAFLGHLEQIKHLAGVALASVLFNILYGSFNFLRMATTGTTAQAVGRGDEDEVVLTGLRNWGLGLGIGLAVLALRGPLAQLGFWILQGSEEVEQVGRLYFAARIWGAPAHLLVQVCIGWFLGRALGYKVLILSAIGNGANVIFNYLFIVQLGLAAQGAGWASALGDGVALGVAGILGVRDLPWQRVGGLLDRVLDGAALGQILSLNSNIMVRTLALVSSFALFTSISAGMGTEILAAHTVILQVVTLAAYFIDGLAFATESLAGLFFGAGAVQHLRALLVLSGGVSFASGIGIAGLFILFPWLFQLLTDQPRLLEQIEIYVIWLLPVLAFGSLAYMLDGYFLGLTQGSILRRASVVSTGLGFLPLAGIAWVFNWPHMLWLALMSYMAARVITLGWCLPATFPSTDPSTGLGLELSQDLDDQHVPR